MTHAYDKMYLHHSRATLARMLDFAVYGLKYDIEEFFNLFISSGLAKLFGEGEPSVTVGRSGVELAYDVLIELGIEFERVEPVYTIYRSEEYWTGWALAYYQWDTGLSFEEIVSRVPIKEIQRMYYPYHEMDIRQFVDEMNDRFESRG